MAKLRDTHYSLNDVAHTAHIPVSGYLAKYPYLPRKYDIVMVECAFVNSVQVHELVMQWAPK